MGECLGEVGFDKGVGGGAPCGGQDDGDWVENYEAVVRLLAREDSVVLTGVGEGGKHRKASEELHGDGLVVDAKRCDVDLLGDGLHGGVVGGQWAQVGGWGGALV